MNGIMTKLRNCALIIGILLSLGAIAIADGHDGADFEGITLRAMSDAVELNGESAMINVEIDNQSGDVLCGTGSDRETLLSYHVKDMDGNLLDYNGVRTHLPADIAAGGSAKVAVELNPADFSFGNEAFVVEIDMVIEGEFWYSEKGMQTASLTVKKGDGWTQPEEPSAAGEFERITITAKNEEVSLNGAAGIEIEIDNQSAYTLYGPGSAEETLLSYHIRDMDGNLLNNDGIRTALPGDIGPGETVEATVALSIDDFKQEADAFAVEIDMVVEGQYWYSEKGLPVCTVTVKRGDGRSQAQPEGAEEAGELAGIVLSTADAEIEVTAGEALEIPVEIENGSGEALLGDGQAGETLLSYHILDMEGNVLNRDGIRTRLPADIGAGEKTTVALQLDPADIDLGTEQLIVEIDMVVEGEYWFSDRGMKPCAVHLIVSPLEAVELASNLASSDVSAVNDQNAQLSLAWRIIEKTVNNTKRRFVESVDGQERAYGGVAAGSTYPQFWVRDNFTAMDATRYFLDRDYLNGWIELHLRGQAENGAIYDWVNEALDYDKNDVETDQESSLVQAACRYVALSGDNEWLKKDMGGATVLERLDGALQYLLDCKTDAQTGLLTGAHTIDWGDVELNDPSGAAVYLGDESIMTVDIYDQSMFVSAARGLADMYDAMGDAERSAFWRERAADISQRTVDALWLADRGYFAVCRHVTPYDHDFDEDAMFAMGGNAMAILAGIADDDMAASIFAAADERQREYGISTVSGVMLPPYPDGVFEHYAVNRAYLYQNGGQWDWFGGRLILGMYQRGFYDLANTKLDEIAAKIADNRGINEWEDPSGAPSGSGDFVGAAGALARAIVEGRYGILLTGDTLSIEPHFDISGDNRIFLIDSASGNRVGYAYEAGRDGATMRLFGGFEGPMTVRIPARDAGNIISVTCNGQQIEWVVVEKHGRCYAEVGLAGLSRDAVELAVKE